MLKSLLASILSIFFVVPTSLGAVSHSQEENTIVKNLDPEDEDVLHGYTYDILQNNRDLIYAFHDHSLGPQVNKYFSAPLGYKYFLDFEEQVDEVVNQLEFFGSDFLNTNMRLRYTLNGAEVDVNEAFFPCDGTKEGAKTNLIYVINNYEFLDVSYIDFDAVIVPFLDIVVKMNFILRFYGETIEVHPFNDTDFITLTSHYVYTDGSKPFFTFHARLLDGLFYEYPSYNPYGFLTDETTTFYDPNHDGNGWYCKYKLQLLAYDSIPLGDIDPRNDGTNAGLTITLPDEQMDVKVRLQFIYEDQEYTFYSDTVTIKDSDIYVSIDEYDSRTSVPRGTNHFFEIHKDNIPLGDYYSINTSLIAVPDRLVDPELGYELYGDKTLPEVGEVGKYYYEPTEEEKTLYNEGRLEELEALSASGTYKIWDNETNSYIPYEGVEIFSYLLEGEDCQGLHDEDLYDYLFGFNSFPFAGRYKFSVSIFINYNDFTDRDHSVFIFTSELQQIDVINADALDTRIEVNVPDSFNLIRGAGEININPVITGEYDDSSFYYDWTMSKNGVVEIIEDPLGNIRLNPINVGIVTLKVTCESEYFNNLYKEINIRVLDDVYGVAKMVVPDGFHYANEDLTVSIDVRGFTKFLNLDIKWEVTGKKGEVLDEAKYIDNKDATLTLLKPESNDYTVKASYEGIELGSVVLEVRMININAFLSSNIWWIVLITIIFVLFVLFINSLNKRGKSTVDHIGRVYDVYARCMSNNTLSKSELQLIKRETTKCLNRVENMNVEAFNQYEKAIRYLRKSLADTKELLKKYDELSAEERSVITDRLDKDLSKALANAREIENAKELIKEYHNQANRQNYEVLKDGSGDKKNKDRV